MKKILFFFLLLHSLLLSGQEFYTIQSDGSISIVDISNCATRILNKVNISVSLNSYIGDITFTKDGKLYGVSSNGKIHQIDINTGIATELVTLPSNLFSPYNSLVSDANGIIYVANSIGNLYTFDPSNLQITNLGTIPFGAAGDLIFYKGQLYMAALNNKLIEVNISNPGLSQIFMDFNANVAIYGIVSLSPNCKNIKAYAIAEDARVFEIDFAKRVLKLVCKIPTSVAIYGAASQYEFNAAAAINIADVNIKNADCGRINGLIKVNAKSGSGILQYSIDGVNFQKQNQFSNLKNGEYHIRILGEKGCNADTTVLLKGAGEPIVKTNLIPNGCGSTDKGLIEIKASPTDSSTILYSIDSIQFGASGLFKDLVSGAYKVYIKTSKGCNMTLSLELPTLVSPTFTNVQAINTSCGLDNGSIKLSSNNSSLNSHKYSLDNINFDSKNTFSKLKAGNYTIYLKDSSNCVVNQNATIAGSEGVKINQFVINSTTCGLNNGKVKVDAAWSNGNKDNLLFQLDKFTPSTQNVFENLSPKNYLLKVTNSINNCRDSMPFKVDKSIAIALDKVEITNADCATNNGQISIIANGNGKLSYQLENADFQSNNTFSELQKGVYNITVKDTQQCSLTIPNILISPDCFVFIPNTFSPNEDGNNDFFTVFGDDNFIKIVKTLRIYNRWGALVFEKNNLSINSPELGWHGNYKNEISNDGVYTYYAEIEFLNNDITTLKGDITLIR